ncbi:MAG: ABC transporter permease [Ekhidna sp.]
MNHQQPPQWILRVIERLCDPILIEGISGDLEEVFKDNLNTKGPLQAQLIYVLQAIGFLRFIFLRKEQKHSNMKAIWTNYLLTSYRSLKRHKTFFAINLIGLITAISCSLFALVYVYDELQYDQEHTDADQIYRLYKRYINIEEGIDHLTYENSGLMAPTMLEEYSQVEDYTRICPWFDKGTITNTSNQKSIISEHIYYADSNFFDFFDFTVISGSDKLLTAPATMMLSEELATALFSDENPIGKTVIGLNDITYTITGVFEKPDRRSSFQFDGLISWTTTVPGVGPNGYRWMNNWLGQAIFSFVKLNAFSNPKELEDELPDMMNRHFEERADQYFLKLMPLNKMHLYSDNILGERGMKTGSIKFIYVLVSSALLILLITVVNYVNISLSRASQSVKEVGIRKTMGSTKQQLMGRFMAETVISVLLASVVSIALLALLLPYLGQLVNKELPIHLLFNGMTILFLFGFISLVSIIVGIYPSHILSKPAPAAILKGESKSGRTGSFRKVLLTLQFAISLLLLVSTVTIVRQIQFMINKPLGFDKEQVIVIDTYNEVGEKITVFEEKLLQHPNIESVSVSQNAISASSYGTTALPEGITDELNVRVFGVDAEFFETYGIQTIEGRTFLKNSNADSAHLIVNQEFLNQLGWEEAVGKHMRFSPEGTPIPIIGVIDNFHYNSLASSKIEPVVMYHTPNATNNTIVRLGGGSVRETMEYIDDIWNELAGRSSLDVIFVDEWFADQYEKETQLLNFSSIYAIISIILCGLGLYGLTGLILQQKSKEISIRKVLGASIQSIVAQMNRQYVLIVLLSFAVAAPMAYYLLDGWLQNFAYKIELDPLPFVIAIASVMVLCTLIVSLLSVKTASTNPTDVLNKE